MSPSAPDDSSPTLDPKANQPTATPPPPPRIVFEAPKGAPGLTGDTTESSDDPAALEATLKPPRLLWLASEGRAILEYGWYLQSSLWLRTLPKGDGHPVLVLPGFTTGDTATRALRRFLNHRGYQAYGWGQGLNLGLRPGLEVRMIRRLRDLHHRHGRRVSIIGWSLGGIYARELARQNPEDVRQVITLGSPFNHSPRANHAWRLYERFAEEKVDDQKARLAGLELPLAVPSTAVYSRTDGIVAWQCCLQDEAPASENVQIYGSHCGLGHNPMALHVIADRLAQPEDQWSMFDRKGLRRLFFRTTPEKPETASSNGKSGRTEENPARHQALGAESNTAHA